MTLRLNDFTGFAGVVLVKNMDKKVRKVKKRSENSNLALKSH